MAILCDFRCHGNKEMRERITKQVLEFNHSYELLSNFYAAADTWNLGARFGGRDRKGCEESAWSHLDCDE